MHDASCAAVRFPSLSLFLLSTVPQLLSTVPQLLSTVPQVPQFVSFSFIYCLFYLFHVLFISFISFMIAHPCMVLRAQGVGVGCRCRVQGVGFRCAALWFPLVLLSILLIMYVVFFFLSILLMMYVVFFYELLFFPLQFCYLSYSSCTQYFWVCMCVVGLHMCRSQSCVGLYVCSFVIYLTHHVRSIFFA